jgi:hypothetical protein
MARREIVMVLLVRRVHVAMLTLIDRWEHRHRMSSDRGQATTEYALVLLGAALVGLLVVGWATSGGGGGKIGRLLDRVFDAITSRVS